MAHTLTKRELLRDIRRYGATFNGSFTAKKYYQRDKIAGKARYLIDEFEAGRLPLDKDLHKVWAQYLNTFTTRRQPVDQLQKLADFDVRKYIAESPKSLFERLFNRDKDAIKYLSATKLRRKYQKYLKLASSCERKGYSYEKSSEIDDFRTEAQQYAAAINDGRITVKTADIPAVDKYLNTVCYPVFKGSEIDQALQKIKQQAAVRSPAARKSAAKTPFWSTLKQKISNYKNRFKTAAVIAVVGFAGCFGIKSAMQTTSNIQKTTTTAKTINQSAVKQQSANTVDFAAAANAKPAVQAQDSAAVREAKIWQNYYDNTIEMLTSKTTREKLYNQINSQLAKGNFTLPQGVSVERLAYAKVMYQLYGLDSSIDAALNSSGKLSRQAQIQLAEDVAAVGTKGQGAKQMALQKHGKLTSRSSYDHASAKQKHQHVKNLQQLRNLHKRAASGR